MCNQYLCLVPRNEEGPTDVMSAQRRGSSETTAREVRGGLSAQEAGSPSPTPEPRSHRQTGEPGSDALSLMKALGELLVGAPKRIRVPQAMVSEQAIESSGRLTI